MDCNELHYTLILNVHYSFSAHYMESDFAN